MANLFYESMTRRNSSLYDDSDRYNGGSFNSFTTGSQGTGHWAATTGTITTATFSETPTTSYIGFRIRPNTTTTATILDLEDASGTTQAALRHTADGTGGIKWQLYRGSDTTLTIVESGNYALDGGNTWHYLQITITLATDSTGSASLQVDEDAAVEASNVQTSASGTETASLEITVSTSAGPISDFYWNTPSGSAPNNDHWGPCVMAGFSPSADGTHDEWDTTAGGDSYAEVDDGQTSMDGDTTYVRTGTTAAKSTYSHTALPDFMSGDLFAFSLTSHCKLEATGSRDTNHVVRTSTSEADGSTITFSNAGGYSGRTSVFFVNPVTTTTITAATLNASEVGFEADAAS